MQLLILALAPSLFWLWWFWSQDKNREELQPLARAFLFGAAAIVPAAFTEFFLTTPGHKPTVLECFFVIGPVEEFCKLAATFLAVGKERKFDEPVDGIVYAAAASLGFAFAENLYYFASLNLSTFLVRAGLSVPSHVFSAVPWAVALGRIKHEEHVPKRILLAGFVVASLLHGMFDALCYQIRYPQDTALLALFALTLLEWRLYMLSMKEMIQLGKRLVHRQIFSSKGSTIMIDQLESPFSWRWFLINLLIGTAVSAISWLIITRLVPPLAPAHPLQVDFVVFSTLMIILGILMAYYSPGRTIREPSLALAIIGFSLSFLTGWPSINPLESAVYFALTGAFGSWLGEMTQQNDNAAKAPVDATG